MASTASKYLNAALRVVGKLSGVYDSESKYNQWVTLTNKYVDELDQKLKDAQLQNSGKIQGVNSIDLIHVNQLENDILDVHYKRLHYLKDVKLGDTSLSESERSATMEKITQVNANIAKMKDIVARTKAIFGDNYNNLTSSPTTSQLSSDGTVLANVANLLGAIVQAAVSGGGRRPMKRRNMGKKTRGRRTKRRSGRVTRRTRSNRRGA
jgi:hypothetical protein